MTSLSSKGQEWCLVSGQRKGNQKKGEKDTEVMGLYQCWAQPWVFSHQPASFFKEQGEGAGGKILSSPFSTELLHLRFTHFAHLSSPERGIGASLPSQCWQIHKELRLQVWYHTPDPIYSQKKPQKTSQQSMQVK